MFTRLIVLAALLLAFTPSSHSSSPQDSATCTGCAAEGGGTSPGTWQDPLGTDFVQVQLITSIGPGTCVWQGEVIPKCVQQSGCPTDLSVKYWSTQAVDFEAIDPVDDSVTTYTMPASTGWTTGGKRKTRLPCGSVSATATLCFQIPAQPNKQCLDADLTCMACGVGPF